MFRLMSTEGEEILRSVSFPNPKIAGQEIKALQSNPADIQFELIDGVYHLSLNDHLVAIAVDEAESGAELWKAKLLNQLALFSAD